MLLKSLNLKRLSYIILISLYFIITLLIYRKYSDNLLNGVYFLFLLIIIKGISFFPKSRKNKDILILGGATIAILFLLLLFINSALYYFLYNNLPFNFK